MGLDLSVLYYIHSFSDVIQYELIALYAILKFYNFQIYIFTSQFLPSFETLMTKAYLIYSFGF